MVEKVIEAVARLRDKRVTGLLRLEALRSVVSSATRWRSITSLTCRWRCATPKAPSWKAAPSRRPSGRCTT